MTQYAAPSRVRLFAPRSWPKHYWLCLLVLLVLFSGWGQRAPWPADEPRFALVAQTMVERGDYFFGHRGIEIYPDKPPMMMWLQAASYFVLGDWNLAFLLPSLLAGLLTLYLVFDLGKRLFGSKAALLSTFGLLVSVQFCYQFKRAQIDPLLVAIVTASVYALLRHVLLGGQTRWLYLGAFLAGIGVITKGVGIIALLLFIPLALLRRWPGQSTSTYRAHASAPISIPKGLGILACFLLAIALWLVPLLLKVWLEPSPERIAYLQNILFKQTAQRYANAWHHQQGPLYFPEVILTTWLPLVLVLPWTGKAWWRRFKRRDPRYVLLLGWCITVLVFFSLSKGKRDMYILPALPMFAVACGPALHGALRNKGFQALGFAFALILALTFTAAGASALLGEPKFEQRFELNYELSGPVDLFWQLFLVVGLGGMLAIGVIAWAKRWRGGFLSACAVLSLIWITVFGFGGYPIVDGSASARLVMARARAAAGEAQIGFVAWKEQNYLQLQGAKTDFGFLKPIKEQRALALAWLLEQPEARRLFMLEQSLGRCIDKTRAIALGQANRRQWWLVSAQAIKPACALKQTAAATGE